MDQRISVLQNDHVFSVGLVGPSRVKDKELEVGWLTEAARRHKVLLILLKCNHLVDSLILNEIKLLGRS